MTESAALVSRPAGQGFALRRARTADVGAIKGLVAPLAQRRILVSKDTVAYYEAIQEFLVAETPEGEVIGCGALHVMWEDLAEVRTLAAAEDWRGRGVGHAVVERLLGEARALGVSRVFCLTFEVAFFRRHGFEVMGGETGTSGQASEDLAVYSELLRSHDEGVAEFLDLARVKPNTLGNTRMIRQL